MLRPINRRESCFNSVLMHISSMLQDAKERYKQTCNKSVLTLSICLKGKNEYFDLLDQCNLNDSELDSLQAPIRSVSDVMRICYICSKNFLHVEKNKVKQLSWEWSIKTITRLQENMNDIIFISETNLIKTNDGLDDRISNINCTPYKQLLKTTREKYEDHSNVFYRLENARKCNGKKLIWRRNQKRQTGRMLKLLDHLASIHYGDNCPYC
jgi:hypothetical protein